jgi:hypothetical protein
MPLLDHFRPPLKRERHWEGLHSAWANAIVMLLNEAVLPPGYVAEPQISFGTQIEVDVPTLEEGVATTSTANGGVATSVYAPPRAALTVATDFSGVDTFEIRVQSEEGGLKLVAAIELISPSNKDRLSHRRAFVRKCATYLQERIGLIIVDIVTLRSGNFHAALLKELAPSLTVDLSEPEALYAVGYHARPVPAGHEIDAWPERLQVSGALPTLPLWLADSLSVPVDLEQTYLAACKALRIRTT